MTQVIKCFNAILSNS